MKGSPAISYALLAAKHCQLEMTKLFLSHIASDKKAKILDTRDFIGHRAVDWLCTNPDADERTLQVLTAAGMNINTSWKPGGMVKVMGSIMSVMAAFGSVSGNGFKRDRIHNMRNKEPAQYVAESGNVKFTESLIATGQVRVPLHRHRLPLHLHCIPCASPL